MTATFTVQEFMTLFPGERRPYAVLADQTILSIQASSGHYSRPKNAEGPHTEYEVGFPKRMVVGSHNQAVEIVPQALLPYAEKLSTEMLTGVFAYVPSEVLERYVLDHGGIVGELTVPVTVTGERKYL